MLQERVNIQYSIDIEELPQEVARLLEKANSSLREIYDTDMQFSATSSSETLSLSTLLTIDQIRKKLASVDYILNDAAQIVNGFISFKVQENAESQGDGRTVPQDENSAHMPPMAGAPANMPDMEALQEQVMSNINVEALQGRVNELREKQNISE